MAAATVATSPLTSDNVTFWNAETPGGDAQLTRLMVGGQEGDYTGAQLVSLEVVTLVAREYFDNGGRASSAYWVRE